MEPSLQRAQVASIYKKGDSKNLGNYRPISLLQSFHKVVAALTQKRLEAALDNWIWKTQYGFRKKRSTAQAVFIIRRLQDLMESGKHPLSIILLDWEKAFDKISHERMMEVLERLKVESSLLHIIQEFYRDPQFKVKVGNISSDYLSQKLALGRAAPLAHTFSFW